MEDRTARISFKIGEFEVDCQGREEFLGTSLVNMATQILDIYLERQDKISLVDHRIKETKIDVTEEITSTHKQIDKSTNTIALDLGDKTGPGLAMAAIAHLSIVKGKDKITRGEIHDEMKTATSIYNKHMSSNLSKALGSLVKNKRLNLYGKDTYTLPDNERATIEGKIA